ncbi:MAG: response regulator [Bacillota bacterium]
MARILVLEDEPTVLLVLSEVLQDEGHEVVTADNGFEGLDWLDRSPPPDLMLLDLFMPGIGGRALLQRIRPDERFRDLPVVLITGAVQHDSDFPPPGSYQGMVRKPFDVEEVIAIVARLTQGHQARPT